MSKCNTPFILYSFYELSFFYAIVSVYEINGRTRQEALNDCPLFQFAESYGSGFTGEYKSGWYIPSLKELADLYKEWQNINSSITTSGGTAMSGAVYWSSTQDRELKDAAYVIGFGDAQVLNQYKNIGKTIRTIRAF